jgi:hypothetical protein
VPHLGARAALGRCPPGIALLKAVAAAARKDTQLVMIRGLHRTRTCFKGIKIAKLQLNTSVKTWGLSSFSVVVGNLPYVLQSHLYLKSCTRKSRGSASVPGFPAAHHSPTNVHDLLQKSGVAAHAYAMISPMHSGSSVEVHTYFFPIHSLTGSIFCPYTLSETRLFHRPWLCPRPTFRGDSPTSRRKKMRWRVYNE